MDLSFLNFCNKSTSSNLIVQKKYTQYTVPLLHISASREAVMCRMETVYRMCMDLLHEKLAR